MIQYQPQKTLLEKYGSFNNFLNNRPILKIFVGYIKPEFLFKNDIYTPIHLGHAIAKSASKEGEISDSDIKWLEENCMPDDLSDDNISKDNRRIGFLTGIYYAYKNYEKIGNPLYFGSFGYRRHLNPVFLVDIEKYDFILPQKTDFTNSGKTMGNHFLTLHGHNLFNATLETLKKIHSEDINLFNEYLSLNKAYMYELYIFKKELFFKYCDWIFPIVFEMLKIQPEKLTNANDSLSSQYMKQIGEMRDVAYAIEILTGYFCYKLTLDSNLNYTNVPIEFFDNKEKAIKNNALIAQLLRNKLKNGK